MTLSEYLKSKGVPADKFGASLPTPVSGHTIRRYLRGEREPSLGTIAEIKEATDGVVSADDWLPMGRHKARSASRVAA